MMLLQSGVVLWSLPPAPRALLWSLSEISVALMRTAVDQCGIDEDSH